MTNTLTPTELQLYRNGASMDLIEQLRAKPTSERGRGGLQQQTEQLLRALQSAGKILDYYHRPDRKPAKGERAGLPDLLIAVRDGLVLGLELKRPGETPTDCQRVWLAALGDNGTWATSISEVVRFLESKGVM